MRTRKLTLKLGAAALTLATLPLAVNQAFAAEYWLKAATVSVIMPNPNGTGTIPVPMWGYASCTSSFSSCGDPTVPGPALTVPPTDTTLRVNLWNSLSIPTSLVINGLIKPMAPVWTEPGSTTPMASRGTSTTARVRSFDVEVDADANTGMYEWNNVKPGTYLYQSGTQPQVQVQMGLYGAVSKNAVDANPTTTPATRAQAYAGAAYEYDNQATLLYSEIDPALHEAVGSTPPTYGTTGPTSTFNYAPKYFLINGLPYPIGAPIIDPTGNRGTTLLRFLNAGLTTHVPMILGRYWNAVAEDGKPYPYARTQYTALLPAAKTLDVLLAPQAGGGMSAIMDRRLSLSNAGVSEGGMLAFLRGQGVGTGAGIGGGGGSNNQPPVANADSYASVKDVTINISALDGVLINDTDANSNQKITAVAVTNGTTTAGGTYTLNVNGSFTYTPFVGYTGDDTFVYRAADPHGAWSSPATVTITVSVPTAPSLALLDNFDRDNVNTLGTNWSQTASTGSSPDIQIDTNKAKAVATALGGLAIWNATTPGAIQGAGFSAATSLVNSALVLKASGGTTAAAPANYIRVRCQVNDGADAATNPYKIIVHTMMGGSGVETFVQQAAFAATGCDGTSSGSLSAKVDAKGLVTAFLNGLFVGGVQLPDVAAWKGTGRIGIQLQTQDATVDDFSGGSL